MLSLKKTFSYISLAWTRRLKVLDNTKMTIEDFSTVARKTQKLQVELDKNLEEKLTAEELKVNK